MILLMEEIPKQPPGMFCKPRNKNEWDKLTKKQLVQDFYPPRENSFPLRLVTNTGKQLENGGALIRKFLSFCVLLGEGGLGLEQLSMFRSVILMHFFWGYPKNREVSGSFRLLRFEISFFLFYEDPISSPHKFSCDFRGNHR